MGSQFKNTYNIHTRNQFLSLCDACTRFNYLIKLASFKPKQTVTFLKTTTKD